MLTVAVSNNIFQIMPHEQKTLLTFTHVARTENVISIFGYLSPKSKLPLNYVEAEYNTNQFVLDCIGVSNSKLTPRHQASVPEI